MAWDPGKATMAKRNADGTWSVPSFRGEEEIYIVNLELQSCSCPSARHRSRCKHVASVQQQAAWLEYTEKARACSDEQLETLLQKYLDDERISGAIRVVRFERKAAVRQEVALKAIFA